MIIPTVGRVVWYHPTNDDPGGIHPGGPQAAIIAHVWSNTNVNLMVLDTDGIPYSRTSVYLVQGEDRSLEIGVQGYAEWPPYQKSQAAEIEKMESQSHFGKTEPEPGQESQPEHKPNPDQAA